MDARGLIDRLRLRLRLFLAEIRAEIEAAERRGEPPTWRWPPPFA